MFGAVAGFLPLLGLFTWRFVDEVLLPGASLLPFPRRVFAENVALLFLAAAPVTLAYAIVKHRVFGIEIVIRRGLRHLLAKNVLRAALFAPAALLAVSLLVNPHRTLAQILFQHPGQFLLIAASRSQLRYRGRLTRWIDGRFFRDAYQREQVLVSLDRGHPHARLLERAVTHGEREAGRGPAPGEVSVVYRSSERGALGLAYSSHGDSAGLRLPETGGSSAWCRRGGRPWSCPGPGAACPGRAGLAPRLAGAAGRAHAHRRAAPRRLPAARREEVRGALRRRGPPAAARRWRPRSRSSTRTRAQAAGGARRSSVRREVLAGSRRAAVNLVKECPRCGTCYDARSSAARRDGAPLVLTLPGGADGRRQVPPRARASARAGWAPSTRPRTCGSAGRWR